MEPHFRVYSTGRPGEAHLEGDPLVKAQLFKKQLGRENTSQLLFLWTVADATAFILTGSREE